MYQGHLKTMVYATKFVMGNAKEENCHYSRSAWEVSLFQLPLQFWVETTHPQSRVLNFVHCCYEMKNFKPTWTNNFNLLLSPHFSFLQQKTFSLYDKDNSGNMDIFELRSALQKDGMMLNSHP